MRIALFLALGSMQLFGAQQIVTTTYSVPAPNSEPEGITIGPDANVWFTENQTGKIGRLAPTTGVITEFSTPDGPGNLPRRSRRLRRSARRVRRNSARGVGGRALAGAGIYPRRRSRQ